jgi:hypothetical protein
MLSLISTLLVVGSTAVTAWGADLTNIDRTIAKEPAYKSKPKYCLLVFGPEATTRVWLVLDGDMLYADRNGNGDLTEEGEQLVAAPITGSSGSKGREWKVGDVTAPGGKVTYTGLTVLDISEVVDSTFKSCGLGIAVNVPIGSTRAFQRAGSVVHPTEGYNLRFADRPKDAPVIHFGGPLRIMLVQPEPFTAGIKAGQTYELKARVGTPGLDKDTAAIMDDTDLFSFVSADHGTVADLEFTDRKGRNQRQHLKLACERRIIIYGPVWAPEEAAEGKARLTVSFTPSRGTSERFKEGFKEWGVAPAVVEVPVIAKPASKAP